MIIRNIAKNERNRTMRNRLREFALLLVFALLAGHCLPAGAESRAETAQEITAECRFETNGKSRDFALFLRHSQIFHKFP